MGRWEPNSRGRLQEAALALFAERGFDQTTTAEIAARAGLTDRTFFRHYADKREVLFGGAWPPRGADFGRRDRGAGSCWPPLEAMSQGLDRAAEMLGETRRDLACHRHAVIAANPELRERELAKLAHYAAAITTALRDRDVNEHRIFGCTMLSSD